MAARSTSDTEASCVLTTSTCRGAVSPFSSARPSLSPANASTSRAADTAHRRFFFIVISFRGSLVGCALQRGGSLFGQPGDGEIVEGGLSVGLGPKADLPSLLERVVLCFQ